MFLGQLLAILVMFFIAGHSSRLQIGSNSMDIFYGHVFSEAFVTGLGGSIPFCSMEDLQ